MLFTLIANQPGLEKNPVTIESVVFSIAINCKFLILNYNLINFLNKKIEVKQLLIYFREISKVLNRLDTDRAIFIYKFSRLKIISFLFSFV